MVAPVALSVMLSPDGEIPAVRAATTAGSIFVLSTFSTTPVEEIVEAATGPVWFQLYVYKDRGASEALVKRVEAAAALRSSSPQRMLTTGDRGAMSERSYSSVITGSSRERSTSSSPSRLRCGRPWRWRSRER